MKSKKVITLSLGDLKDLGIISRKEKKKPKRRRGKRVKIVLVDANTGAVIGGTKSDSSQMTGYSQPMQQAPQFTNTANVNSAIQQANLEAIERSNKKTKEEVPARDVDESNQLIVKDRFHAFANNIDNRFNEIVPYLERIHPLIEQSQKQQELITQGMGAMNKLQNDYFNLRDNFGIGDTGLSSNEFKDQGRGKPIVSEDIFNTPLTPIINRFNTLDETDKNNTPVGISQSLLKALRSVDKLGNQYGALTQGSSNDSDDDAGGQLFTDVPSPPPEKQETETKETETDEDMSDIPELQRKAGELLMLKKLTAKLDGRSKIYKSFKKSSTSNDRDVLTNLMKTLNELSPKIVIKSPFKKIKKPKIAKQSQSPI